jgi:16S rRNA (uracil1498-N3)-methyltransferase
MPRFFVEPEAICEGHATVAGGDAYHIARSLRMAVGDEITLADGSGKEYLCRLTKIRDEECTAEVISEQISHSESPAEITLYMAYPKSDKLELIIQKSVELGAARIVPFESSRCIKRPKAEKIEKQTARLQRIAEEAAKQCGRARLPIVREPISFKKMLEEAATAELSLFCYEGGGTRSLKEVLSSDTAPSSISVIIGSEGGFSPEEAEAAVAAKLTPVNLGPRILRCETAPMYALSAISYQLEL